mgnify:CR=1 FL=1
MILSDNNINLSVIRDVDIKLSNTIPKQANIINNQIDLSNKDITLVCISDINIENAVKSFLNCLARVKFTDSIFFTSKISDKHIQLLSKYTKIKNISPITSILDYNKFMICQLYKYINTNFILIIQPDSTIIFQDSWSDDFLLYDYIGAPWPKHILDRRNIEYKLVSNFPDNAVGNGGFCLRSIKLLKTVAELPNINVIMERRNYIEDIVYCSDVDILNIYKSKHIYIAPYDIAGRFSYEYDRTFANIKWFGAHGKNTHFINEFIKNINITELLPKIKEIYK